MNSQAPLKAHASPQAQDLDLLTHPAVYRPAEDSYLLAEALAPSSRRKAEPLKGLRLLDLGCGGGLVGLWAAIHGAEVTAVDLNSHAVELTAENARRLGLEERSEVHRGNLFLALPAGTSRFDIIACNPPYLPQDPERRTSGTGPDENPDIARWQAGAVEAGTDGGGVAREVLARARDWLIDEAVNDRDGPFPAMANRTPPGLYLLLSSLTQLSDEDWHGWRTEVVAKEVVGSYETLRVHRALPITE